MSSPELAIAKTALLASLLRPPPSSSTPAAASPAPVCSRSEVDAFHSLLDAAIARCSAPNVQKCKIWILDHVVLAANRTVALAKFVAALVKSVVAEKAEKKTTDQISPRRRALHLLYIINDLLHHTVVRDKNNAFARALEPLAPAMLYGAASFPDCPKHAAKLARLLDLWAQNEYFKLDVQDNLVDMITRAPIEIKSNNSTDDAGSGAAGTGRPKYNKDVPYMLPPTHGDLSVAWYDLPAANWLPFLVPGSSKPLDPSLIRPLQFMPGPANVAVVKAVKNLLSSADRIFARPGGATEDATSHIVLSELGERTELDPTTGEVVGGETYYGWSREFCQKMKARAKGVDNVGILFGEKRQSSRSRGRDSSRDSSRPAYKRRRLSRSRSSRSRSSRSRSRSRSRDGDRDRRGRPRDRDSRSRSRSRSRDGNRGHHNRSRDRDNQSRSHTPSQSVSRDGDQRGSRRSRTPRRNGNRSPSRSRSRRSYSQDRRQSRRDYRRRSYSPRSRSPSHDRSRSQSNDSRGNNSWGNDDNSRGNDNNSRNTTHPLPFPPPFPPDLSQMAAAMAALPVPWPNLTANPFPDLSTLVGGVPGGAPGVPWWPLPNQMPVPVPGAPPPPPQSQSHSSSREDRSHRGRGYRGRGWRGRGN